MYMVRRKSLLDIIRSNDFNNTMAHQLARIPCFSKQVTISPYLAHPSEASYVCSQPPCSLRNISGARCYVRLLLRYANGGYLLASLRPIKAIPLHRPPAPPGPALPAGMREEAGYGEMEKRHD